MHTLTFDFRRKLHHIGQVRVAIKREATLFYLTELKKRRDDKSSLWWQNVSTEQKYWRSIKFIYFVLLTRNKTEGGSNKKKKFFHSSFLLFLVPSLLDSTLIKSIGVRAERIFF